LEVEGAVDGEYTPGSVEEEEGDQEWCH
jgi:hypothetical protein